MGSEIDVKDDFKNVDFSWVLALGYDLPSGLGFFARYNHGLSSLDDDSSDPAKAFNRVFQFGLNYTFSGMKK